MKKPLLRVLLLITCLTLVFTLGFFLGRNQNRLEAVITPLAKSAEADPLSSAEPSPVSININTASVSDLMLLPGVGEVLAQRILEYRDAHGGFTAAQELLNVEGIGQTRLEELLDFITIGG